MLRSLREMATAHLPGAEQVDYDLKPDAKLREDKNVEAFRTTVSRKWPMQFLLRQEFEGSNGRLFPTAANRGATSGCLRGAANPGLQQRQQASARQHAQDQYYQGQDGQRQCDAGGKERNRCGFEILEFERQHECREDDDHANVKVSHLRSLAALMMVKQAQPVPDCIVPELAI
jgi:hypothetical protein